MGRPSRFLPLRDDVFSSPGVERNSSATLTTPGCSEATSRKGSAERQGGSSAQPRPRSEDAVEHVWREAPSEKLRGCAVYRKVRDHYPVHSAGRVRRTALAQARDVCKT